MKRKFQFLSLFLCALIGLLASARSATNPNVVFILADDLGYGDLGCYGGEVPTPQIDRLAREGVRLTQFYSNGPECSPTRTAFMTGRYPQRIGGLECAIGTGNVGRYDDAIRLRTNNDLGLPATENTLVRSFKNAGYTAVLFGKWHLGYETKFSPRAHGFDTFFGPLGGTVDYFHHVEPEGQPMLFENDQPIPREGYLTDLITDRAVAFIAGAGTGPFFLYVPYTAPHTPIQGPNDHRAAPVSPAEWNQGTPETYAAMIRSLDRGVGRILDALEKHRLADEALVVFASDNGGTKRASNGPFSGYKGGLFEGGIRVPCLLRWPGQLKPGTVSAQVSLTMDLTASLVRLSGAPAPTRPFDGIDLIARLASGAPPADRTVFWRARRGQTTWRAVRAASLKLVSRADGSGVKDYLFDLDADHAEKNNLLGERAADATRLRALLKHWEDAVRPMR